MKLFKLIETNFDNYDLTIRTYLSKVLNNLGMQYTHTQIFGVIFDGIKGVMQNLLFYIEDSLTEQNIFTASRRSSVFSLAKISGFEPQYGTAANGVIVGSLHINNGLNNTVSNLYIKNHTLITNRNTGIFYSIVLPTDTFIFTVTNPLVKCQFNVVQGQFVTNKYTAIGNNLETIHINCTELYDKEYISVYVDGKKWNQVSNFYDMSEDGEEYMYSIGYDNKFDIIFGNGIYGKKLIEGQVVEVTYLRHQGEYGNILSNDNYDLMFTEYVTDNFGNAVNANDFIDLSILTTISGGSNADSIDFIRNMTGKNSRSLVYSDAASLQVFLKRFSFVGYNNAFVSLNNNILYILALQNFKHTSYSNESSYNYFEMKDSEMLLNNEQEQMIINTLNNSNHCIAGFNVKFIKPILRKYSIMCYVKTNNSYAKDVIRELITKSIYEYFISLSYDVKFVAKSAIINYVLNNDTDNLITSLDLNIISEYNEQAYKSQEYLEYTDDININNEFITKQVKYSNTYAPGLDKLGNISLNSIVEIPRICGGFKYYISKGNLYDINDDYIITKPVEIYFLNNKL